MPKEINEPIAEDTFGHDKHDSTQQSISSTIRPILEISPAIGTFFKFTAHLIMLIPAPIAIHERRKVHQEPHTVVPELHCLHFVVPN